MGIPGLPSRLLFIAATWLTVTAALLILTWVLPAQTTSTAIVGTVTDPSGAAVVGARITVRNVRTGVVMETVTTTTGDYAVPLLDPGEYTVMVEAEGFKPQTRTGVRLQVNEKVRVDFELQIGEVTEQITVTSEAPSLRTDEATLGGTVEQRRLVELPMNGRNVGNFAILNPGVMFGSRHGYDGMSGAGGGIPIPGQTIALVANGQRETNQHATLDGVVATEARVNTVPFSPSPEAMEEVKVLTGSYSAEYGYNSGAQIVLVTRSGTNEFHGSAYEFLRNEKLDAEGFFQNFFTPVGQPRIPKSALRQNQFGFVTSGPVYVPRVYDGRNRSFFMFNYEGRRRRESGTIYTALVPDDRLRAGDFSALLNRKNAAGQPLPPVTIVDPYSSPDNPVPFPGNIIPPSRIAPAAKALLDFWPKAQNPLPDPISGINYRNPGRSVIDDNQYFLRLDHVFSSRDRVFARYAATRPRWFSVTSNPNFSYEVIGKNDNLATQWLHIFTPTVINELRFGYTRSDDDTFNPRSNTDFSLEKIGIFGFNVLGDNNRPLTRREAGIPTMDVAGFMSLAERDGGNGFDQNDLYQFNDNLSIVTGAHTLKMGFDFRRVALFRGAANVPRGAFRFTGNIAGNAFAAFLLGVPSSTESPEGLPLTDVRQNRFAWYVQDDWKPVRNLTLNLGIRWEYNSPATDIRGLWRSVEWRQGLNNPPEFVPAQIRTVYQFYDPSKRQFMPRIGLAWRLSEDWVIRSGFGIFYNVHQLNNYTILNLNPPLSGSVSFSNTVRNGVIVPGTTVYSFTNPFGEVNPASPTVAVALNRDNFQPYVAQWSFDIQTRLPARTTLTVGYVGNKTTHLDNTVEKNNPDPFIPTGPGDTVQSRRPIQYIIDNGVLRPLTRLRFLDSGANSWYNGLQVSLRKEYTHGLLFTLSYTFSKTLMEGYGRNEGDGINPNTYQNPRNRAADKGRVGWDARHVAVMSFIYDIPTPTVLKNGFLRHVFGGWQANGIVTFRSGFPFTVTQGNIINTANSPVRPDRIADGRLKERSIHRWFDPDAFRIVSCVSANLPEICKYGNAGRGILEGPGFKNLDFSLFKNFTLRESLKLQFRAEFFNLTNTPQFGVPNRTLRTDAAYRPSKAADGTIKWPSQSGIQGGPGTVTSLISPMRQIQFGLKLIW